MREKNNLVLYNNLSSAFTGLSDADAGKLIKSIFEYHLTGNTKTEGVVAYAFNIIKECIDENKSKYHAKCLKNKESAKMRWDANACERIGTDANIIEEKIIEEKIIKKKEEKINKKEFGEFKNVLLSDAEYQKLFNLYFDKLDEALETLSVWKQNKNKKTTHNYGTLLKTQWVYKKVMEEQSGNASNGKKDTIQSNDDVFRSFLNKKETE